MKTITLHTIVEPQSIEPIKICFSIEKGDSVRCLHRLALGIMPSDNKDISFMVWTDEEICLEAILKYYAS
jgi:hypothetical protein